MSAPSVRRVLFSRLFLAGLGLLLVTTAALAQGAPAAARPYKLPPNLLEYFKKWYPQLDDEHLIGGLQETPDGPLGQITVYGKLAPTADVAALSGEVRARAAALAFIADQSALFNIPDLADIKEISLKTTDEGRSALYYIRYIGSLPLVGQFISVDVDADGAIVLAHATLTPVPPQLYRAVAEKTITEDEVMQIVQRDLGRGKKESAPSITQLELRATWRPPYVVWGASGALAGRPAFSYVIDAFTGEITNKTCTALVSAPGGSPCD
jgi:hypothetical protein